MNDEWAKQVDDRLGNLEIGLSANSMATQRIESNTTEVVELMRDLKAAWRVIDIASKVAKPIGWLAGIGAAVLAFMGTIKGWWLPK